MQALKDKKDGYFFEFHAKPIIKKSSNTVHDNNQLVLTFMQIFRSALM